MSELINVDVDVLSAHARKVSQLADDVGVAADAVAGIDLGGGAFGVLCAWMVPPAQVVSGVVLSHSRETRVVLNRTEGELRGVASDFSAAEDANVDVLRAVGGVLG